MNKYFEYLFILFIPILLLNCREVKDNMKDFDKISVQLGNKKYEIPLSFKSEFLSNKTRIWKNLETNFVYDIGGENDSILVSPIDIKMSNINNYFILDPRDAGVKKYGSKNNFIKKYGNYGRGPGELLYPMRFDINSLEDIVALDPNSNKCEVFNNDTSFSVNVFDQPTSVCFLAEDEFVTFQSINPIERSCLIRYNYKTKDFFEYENIINSEAEEIKNLGPIPFLNGEIHRISDKKIVYAPKYLDCFVIFSEKGKILKAYKTIENKENIYSIESHLKSIDYSSLKKYTTALRSIVLNDYLILMSSKATKKFKAGVADFYSLNDGKYKFSIKLHSREEVGRYFNVYITDRHLYYFVEDTSIKVFDYKIVN